MVSRSRNANSPTARGRWTGNATTASWRTWSTPTGYSNTKARRDKLTQEQRDALQELGVDWA
ncbi:hypothetical protein [Streptomyces sp. NPDC096012]|uniref:hypothetical protein n=1 Tax=Streptomyces sp. NPDC096012 TaxID=3155684 RepID=UPI00336AC9BC